MSQSSQLSQPTWILREVTEDARDAILDLRRRVFAVEDPEKRDPVFWTWEFMDSPDGKARLFVAEDGNSVVGHYAILPQDFSFAGDLVKGSIVVDVMTHPDYRFQGMFKKIGRHSLAQVSDSIEFSTGYPIRKEVMPGHLSIGWVDYLKIPVLLRPLRWGALAKRFGIPFGSALDILAQPWRAIRRQLSPSLRTDESIRLLTAADATDLEEVAANALSDVVHRVRSAAHFQWRYFESPVWRYRILGLHRDGALQAYIVIRQVRLMGTESLAIVDMASRKGEERSLTLLLDQEVASGAADGLAVAGAMITRGSAGYAALRKAGFYPGPHRFSLILHASDPAIRERLANPTNNWFLMWGDTDDV